MSQHQSAIHNWLFNWDNLHLFDIFEGDLGCVQVAD
jgi:hypothetical protein